MNIKQMLLTKNDYSRPGKALSKIKGIVIHWVANTNSTAKANRNFFENRKLGKTGYGSAHYIIDLNGDVVQCLPDAELAYHVGSETYTKEALSKLSSYPNNCTIGIECCHIKDNGEMSKETYASLVELVVLLLKKYNLTEKNVWLHKEVVGWKDCHKWFCDNPAEWVKFKQIVARKIDDKSLVKEEVKTASPHTTLKLGMKGEEVKELQKLLNKNVYTLKVDGDFGSGTEKAVKDFQKKNNLTVDGIVGQKTWEKLV